MTKLKTPPAFWVTAFAALALASIAIFNPPERRMVQDFPDVSGQPLWKSGDTL